MNAGFVIRHLAQRGLTISTAESLTGGGLGYKLTSVPGASAVYRGGVNAYTNDVKMGLLGVRKETLTEFGAVSTECAAEMATGIQRLIPADIAVSLTGVAGPGSDGDNPEGRVCFGFVFPGHNDSFRVDYGSIGRKKIREAAIRHIVSHLAIYLKN